MKRVCEPELMTDPAQVEAYGNTDFSESHDRLIEIIAASFPEETFSGVVLNLGCGTGDDAFRFLKKFPESRMLAIDGSQEMIAYAEQILSSQHQDLIDRIEFVTGYIQSGCIPKQEYAGIISNGLLHHLRNPAVLWKTIQEHSDSACPVFVGDLRRPDRAVTVNALVNMYAEGAPEILRRDFRNSLIAAFTIEEVSRQLNAFGLSELEVHAVGDRHLAVHGIIGESR